MINNDIKLLMSLYLFGRKVRDHYKNKNADEMLTGLILLAIKQNRYNVTSLSEYLGTKISAVSEKIISLEKGELIAKGKSEDEREYFLKLTLKGERRLSLILKLMNEHCVQALKALSEKEKETFLAIIDKLLKK